MCLLKMWSCTIRTCSGIVSVSLLMFLADHGRTVTITNSNKTETFWFTTVPATTPAPFFVAARLSLYPATVLPSSVGATYPRTPRRRTPSEPRSWHRARWYRPRRRCSGRIGSFRRLRRYLVDRGRMRPFWTSPWTCWSSEVRRLPSRSRSSS